MKITGTQRAFEVLNCNFCGSVFPYHAKTLLFLDQAELKHLVPTLGSSVLVPFKDLVLLIGISTSDALDLMSNLYPQILAQT